MDLVPREWRRPGLAPVGRLDIDTTGLLLLTNDGGLAYRLTHPRYGVEREYLAVVDRPLAARDVRRLVTGVRLPEGPGRAASVKPLARRAAPWLGHRHSGATPAAADGPWNGPCYSIVLMEGQKREIRLMFRAVGHRVLRLHRVRMGGVRLGSLAMGQLRTLSTAEVQRLKALVAGKPSSEGAQRVSPLAGGSKGGRPPWKSPLRPPGAAPAGVAGVSPALPSHPPPFSRRRKRRPGG